MADEVRVALLARPGPARDQIHKALTELGAALVAEGDPAELDPGIVGQAGPTIVLVSLEPAIESALERFDDLLSTDGVEVMYDDAEVTRKLEGWDLNRWARHLAAKLIGRDVLPPPPDGAPAEELEMHPVPGLPPTPAQLMDNEKLEDYAAESNDLAEWVPTNPSLTGDTPPEPVEDAPREREADELPNFDIDLSSIESAMQGLPDADAPAGDAPVALEAATDLDFEGDFSLDLGGLEELIGKEQASDAAASAMPDAHVDTSTPTLADFEPSETPINFSNFGGKDDAVDMGGGMDDDVAALAAQLEAFEQSDTRETARDPDFSWAPNDDAAKAKEQRATPKSTTKPIPDVPAPSKDSFDFGNLSLVDEDTLPVEPIKPKPVAAPNFDSLNLTLESLDETAVAAKAAAAAAAAKPAGSPAAPPKVNFDTGSLSLEIVELEPHEGSASDGIVAAPGALLVVAGMGGPDAVRQLLSHLPNTLPVPVLLYQHLEVGKHERLVDQLAKVSRLPVYLAVDGAAAQPGKVAVLPAGMAAGPDGDGLRFKAGLLNSLVAALPASDSVLVVLSGADPGLVPAANALTNAGGQAYVQSPDTCFDAAAAQAIASNGAPAMQPPQIAARVAARWLA